MKLHLYSWPCQLHTLEADPMGKPHLPNRHVEILTAQDAIDQFISFVVELRDTGKTSLASCSLHKAKGEKAPKGWHEIAPRLSTYVNHEAPAEVA